MNESEEACIILLRLILVNLDREGYIKINGQGEFANIFLRGRDDHLMPISVPIETYDSIRVKIAEVRSKTLWENHQ